MYFTIEYLLIALEFLRCEANRLALTAEAHRRCAKSLTALASGDLEVSPCKGDKISSWGQIVTRDCVKRSEFEGLGAFETDLLVRAVYGSMYRCEAHIASHSWSAGEELFYVSNGDESWARLRLASEGRKEEYVGPLPLLAEGWYVKSSEGAFCPIEGEFMTETTARGNAEDQYEWFIHNA